MSSYERLASLPLTIESYRLEGLKLDISSAFTRHSTLVHLAGAGQEGIGEDATYDTADQQAFQASGREFPLTGRFTLDTFSSRLAER